MSNLQAQAEQPDTTPTVADPLDMAVIPNGAEELSAYQAELLELENGTFQDETEHGENPLGDGLTPDTATEEEQPTEVDAPTNEEEERTQMRPRLKDPLDIAVASLAKAKGISLIEAAKIIGGDVAKQETQAAAEDEGPTVSSVTDQIKSLMAEKKEAFANLEFEKVSDLDEQLDALRETRESLRVQEATTKANSDRKAQQDFDDKFSASEAKATSLYPGINDPNSAHYQKAMELDAQMRELGDPLYHSPDKPMLLAKAAAAQLGIMMAKPGTAPVSKVKTAPIQPASGNRGTTVATAPAAKLDQVIDGVVSEADYEALVGKLAGIA